MYFQQENTVYNNSNKNDLFTRIYVWFQKFRGGGLSKFPESQLHTIFFHQKGITK